MNFKMSAIVMALISWSLLAISQSTFSSVYTILQTHCSGSGCHDGSTQTWDVTGSQNDVYNEIVGVDVLNPYALTKKNKLIEPGRPATSFLLRKIAWGLSTDLQLEQPFEGDPMPQNQSKLSDADIELVRQWILFGAPDSTGGEVVNEQVLVDYYNGMGIHPIPPTPLPNSSEGFQIHFGPFFLAPQEEKEYSWKYKMPLPDSSEVTRLQIEVNNESHHLAMFKFYPEADSSFSAGLREVTGIIDAAAVFFAADVIAQFPNSTDMELPGGTGFFWEGNSAIDINYHLKNFDPDSILACELYLNVYYQPRQASTIEMKSRPVYYGGSNPFVLKINDSGQDTTFSMEQYDTTSNEVWKIWALQAHTHKLGKDYDIWVRNPDGSKGEHIYEGFYNEDYTFPQGFYDWEHAPFRRFASLKPVKMSSGLIHEAVFKSDTSKVVSFGLTTEDEMFVTYMHYTVEEVTGIADEPIVQKSGVKLSPNPSTDMFNLSYSLEEQAEVVAELYNVVGERIATLINEKNPSGKYHKSFSMDQWNQQPGVYIVRLTVNGSTTSGKLIYLKK